MSDSKGSSESGAGNESAQAQRDGSVPAPPRVVTTGRKDSTFRPCPVVEPTGERFEIFANGRRGISVVRHLESVESAPSNAAFIDALAFSVVPPGEMSYVWLLEQMQQFLDIGTLDIKRGMFGFRHSARFGDGAGVLAWGGESQRGRVYFSLMGKGCSMVNNWCALSHWLEQHAAVIKRADLACDDFDGQVLSIAWAIEQYQGDGFTAGGRRPSHTCIGDWLEGESSTKGRTLGIGNRASGKYARIYEKGKQLGEGDSKWTRFEVEWRAQDRYIPFDILTRPGHYLAGSYPCLAFLSAEQSVIKTIAKSAQIAFDAAVENAKQHCGKLVNLLLSVVGGDYAEVVHRLSRPGFPARIDPYSYHVKRNPTMLDRDMRGVAA